MYNARCTRGDSWRRYVVITDRYTGTQVPSYPFTFSEQCLSGLFLLRGDIGYLDEPLVINRGNDRLNVWDELMGANRQFQEKLIIKVISSNGWGYA